MSNTYWETPQEITNNYASLVETIQQFAKGQGGKLLTLGFIVHNGLVRDVLEPKTATIEPRGRTNGRACSWWQVIRRVQSVGINVQGKAVVSLSIALDAQEQPVSWTAPECVKVEPRVRV